MQDNKYIIPLSIVVAGALIAGAVFYSKAPAPVERPAKAALELAIRPVGESDHIIGNAAAPVVLVEYSDAQCPFCQRFHVTMKELMGTYGKNGQLAWVYRHMPLDQIHPDARRRSEGLECAASLGGSAKFWEFADALYAIPTNQLNLNPDLGAMAASIGLNKTDFNSCLDSDKFAARVQDDTTDAVRAGGKGTPFNVLVLQKPVSDGAREYIANLILQSQLSDEALAISKDGRRVMVGGAFPTDMMKGIIDALLK